MLIVFDCGDGQELFPGTGGLLVSSFPVAWDSKRVLIRVKDTTVLVDFVYGID